MKTWIDHLNRINGELLFHEGYVTSRVTHVTGQPEQADHGARREAVKASDEPGLEPESGACVVRAGA